MPGSFYANSIPGPDKKNAFLSVRARLLRAMWVILFSVYALMQIPLTYAGVTLNPVKTVRFQQWEFVLFEQDSGALCAAETESNDGTVVRFNFYKKGDAFIELVNEKWNFRNGELSFRFEFDDGHIAELKGVSQGDGWSHDLIEKENIYIVLGLFVKNKKVQIVNGNGKVMAKFSLDGAENALRTMDQCVGGI